jgi:hypothetical protein
MDDDSHSQRKAQLDKSEREHLEEIAAEMRGRVEDNVRFQLNQAGLDTEPDNVDALDEETQRLVEAIKIEAVDGHTWDEAFEQYINGVGYTIVNRLAALRCMEVRDFVTEEVTVFKENGLTPAAETLVHEEFLLEDEAILEAYHNTCDDLAEEIEILFDRSSAYSLVDPDEDTFEELCGELDEIPDEVWRADDVLGWVYEYYNRAELGEIRKRARNEGISPRDVAAANQFYTPHWVVRMLTDNSLTRTYLERTNSIENVVSQQEHLNSNERKERSHVDGSPSNLAELSTYLVPGSVQQNQTSVEPEELRVIDPACGSGHFLLYAFDVLERIWWEERPEIPREDIPSLILEHNIYGVDIDLRACQLASFNLYLKARQRVENENGADFQLPSLNIVCADSRASDLAEIDEVIAAVSEDQSGVNDALNTIVNSFENIEGLGSLLNVKGTLSEEFTEGRTQLTDDWSSPRSLSKFLEILHEELEQRREDNFTVQSLKSFVNLLAVLSKDYDVALMNPPYGSQRRMPVEVREYVDEHYEYLSEYYINFFEACERLVSDNGRIGMLVPRSFMYNQSFEHFREDFIGQKGTFDFLAEFGEGILDYATVRTVGTVIRAGDSDRDEMTGDFFRLHDVPKGEKEQSFLHSAFDDPVEDGVRRRYTKELSEFALIPGYHISYWMPRNLRELYSSEAVFDADNANVDRDSLGVVKHGATTGDNSRFIKTFWEVDGDSWAPISKGGEDAWILPRINLVSMWGKSKEVDRYANSVPRNTEYFFDEALTFTVAKEGGRRFGYLSPGSSFDAKGSVVIPDSDIDTVLAYSNSRLFDYLMLGQTPDRMWQIGMVSKIPWHSDLVQETELAEQMRRAIGIKIALRSQDFNSPYYRGPALLQCIQQDLDCYYQHPHQDILNRIDVPDINASTDTPSSLNDLTVQFARYEARLNQELQTIAKSCDDIVFNHFNVDEDQQSEIFQEIALRTNEDPRDTVDYDPKSVTESEVDSREQVENLLLHFTMEILDEDDDGIVPISDVGGEQDLLSRIEQKFDSIFGKRASERLAEVDQTLGNQSADEEAYPNLRTWISSSLFDRHVSAFDRTPILWRLTTERLVSDPGSEGFACLIDYHQLDAGVLDRLQNRYLEPRKTLLRERRSAANRRRGDESLSASEKAAAAEEYARCESGLEQISAFEDRLTELAQSKSRDLPDETREAAAAATELVAQFREQTAGRLEKLDELAALEDVDMEDLFSPSFYETVQHNREEWLDALSDLETAFEAYVNDGSEPVGAHLYDLFEYFDDLVGSAHYASNGILFTTYYYDKFEDAGQTTIADGGDTRHAELLAALASDLDEYKEIAEEIANACDEIAADISSDWSERALSEITTAGYSPNRKHGVVINIMPLVDAEIVPVTVDKQVI